jgi:hypothetical protein
LLGLNAGATTGNAPGVSGTSGGKSGSDYEQESRAAFDAFRSRFEAGGGAAGVMGGGGASGGGGGGGSSGGGGSAASMDNPFVQQPPALPAWAGNPKAAGGFSSTGPPGAVGETYEVGGLTCVVTQNKGSYSYRSCVPTAKANEPAAPDENQPPATGGIPGDLGDYGNVA